MESFKIFLLVILVTGLRHDVNKSNSINQTLRPGETGSSGNFRTLKTVDKKLWKKQGIYRKKKV
jgi:hypothetical protein